MCPEMFASGGWVTTIITKWADDTNFSEFAMDSSPQSSPRMLPQPYPNQIGSPLPPSTQWKKTIIISIYLQEPGTELTGATHWGIPNQFPFLYSSYLISNQRSQELMWSYINPKFWLQGWGLKLNSSIECSVPWNPTLSIAIVYSWLNFAFKTWGYKLFAVNLSGRFSCMKCGWYDHFKMLLVIMQNVWTHFANWSSCTCNIYHFVCMEFLCLTSIHLIIFTYLLSLYLFLYETLVKKYVNFIVSY